LRERSCAQRWLSSVKHGGSPCSDFFSFLKSSMAVACVQGGIRCSRQLSWLNSKVSADDEPRLFSSAEPFHTQVHHRPFNSSTHDSHRSSNSFRGYFAVCRSNRYLRARTATCGARFIVQLQHMVRRILSPTHCSSVPNQMCPRIRCVPNQMCPESDVPESHVPNYTRAEIAKYRSKRTR
jgi:hypothetical protein